MIGEEATPQILAKIRGTHGNGKRFRINLYSSRLKPQARGKDIWKCEPQVDEIYYCNGAQGVKWFFHGPIRERNALSGVYEVCGSFRTQWYIDSRDMTLYTKKTHAMSKDTYVEWPSSEYRIVLEPYDRCWNQKCIGLTFNRAPEFSRSMNPKQFADFVAGMKNQSQGDLLLKRKNQNQAVHNYRNNPPSNYRKRSRAVTPSPILIVRKNYKRKNIICKTPLQRKWQTAQLKNAGKIVLIKIGTMYVTFQHNAVKLAKYTYLSLQKRDGVKILTVPEDEMDRVRACCCQKSLRLITI
jgi:hypothetical protein